MKSYSIGREHTCNIILKDPQKIISRTHAIINVADNGKITIIDQSTNGTYVNGMRISSNVPVPVSRKDKVSFAHVATLDWSQVPGGFAFSTIAGWVLGALAGIAIILALVFFIPWSSIFSKNDTNPAMEPIPTPMEVQVETPPTEVVEEAVPEEEAIQEPAESKPVEDEPVKPSPKKKTPKKNNGATNGNKQNQQGESNGNQVVDEYEIPD